MVHVMEVEAIRHRVPVNTTSSLQVCQLSSTCSTSYTEAHDKLHSDPEAVETVTVSTNGAIDPYRFNMFMSDLLAERGSDIKQMHGTLSIQVSITQLTPYLFHTYAAHTNCTPASGRSWQYVLQC